jgi:GNAT superfamily N-acetyltransferase
MRVTRYVNVNLNNHAATLNALNPEILRNMGRIDETVALEIEYVSDQRDIVVAALIVSIDDASLHGIHALYVLPHFRGRGLAWVMLAGRLCAGVTWYLETEWELLPFWEAFGFREARVQSKLRARRQMIWPADSFLVDLDTPCLRRAADECDMRIAAEFH